MLKQKIEETINKQINAEFYSAYLYLSMSAYFESINLKGFASWMYVQYQEEVSHAMKFYRYVNERGGKVILQAISAPETKWESPLHVFEETLKHECHVTELINNLVDIAIEEKDHATNNFLQWYVAEQVEEEANATDVIEQIKMINDSKDSLYAFDKELGLRVFVDATINQAA